MNTRFVLLGAVGLVALTGCKDDNAPKDPNGIWQVLVTPQEDSARLRNQNEFVLAVLPIDGNDQVVLSEDLEVSVTLTGSGAPTVQNTTQDLAPPEARPLAAAIHMDNSSSMEDNDPDGLRNAAARAFWDAVLGQGGNEVALLSFGGNQGTSGFSRTRMLQSWTTNRASLEAALGNAQLANGTELYRSAAEVVRWIDTTTNETARRRVMVLFTDGRPDDETRRAELFAAAENAGVQINTVGIGPASDQSPRRNSNAVDLLREIATTTGGFYAGAEDAEGLGTVFRALAARYENGALLVTVRVNAAPAAGTTLRGTVRVANDQGDGTGEWSFVAK